MGLQLGGARARASPSPGRGTCCGILTTDVYAREATHCSPRRIRADSTSVSWPRFSGAIFTRAGIRAFGVPGRVNSMHALSRKVNFARTHTRMRAGNSNRKINRITFLTIPLKDSYNANVCTYRVDFRLRKKKVKKDGKFARFSTEKFEIKLPNPAKHVTSFIVFLYWTVKKIS